ncbi:MAG: SGNH/GDSL hydrolase family protein [Victivallales bacterium]|nr:SGNH/GDSL hydrolase family protein [Victivallales bacterium]
MTTLKLNTKTWTLSYGKEKVQLTPPSVRKVRGERYENLPLYDEKAAGWLSARRLLAIQAHECTLKFAFVPGSVSVKMEGQLMELGRDYKVNDVWGTVGRLEEGRITQGEQVSISYSYYPSRMDTVFLDKGGHLAVKQGKEGMAHPEIPSIPKSCKHLANLYWHGDFTKLTEDMLYPVTETAFPNDLISIGFLPEKTLEKLRAGKPVCILAWGDSVTSCTYMLPEDRWQHQFCRRLRERFPKAKIEMLSEGWGGRNTSSFFAVPPGEPHNFEENVLASKPDLIISEFVNDFGLSAEVFKANYDKIQKAFAKIGAEWIIMTPHYTRPDSMGLTCSKNCDDDPRPYVTRVREFAAKNHIPLADASRYWGRLYRQGIPCEILFSNGINHPLKYGLSLYADALMLLFPINN